MQRSTVANAILRDDLVTLNGYNGVENSADATVIVLQVLHNNDEHGNHEATYANCLILFDAAGFAPLWETCIVADDASTAAELAADHNNATTVVYPASDDDAPTVRQYDPETGYRVIPADATPTIAPKKATKRTGVKSTEFQFPN